MKRKTLTRRVVAAIVAGVIETVVRTIPRVACIRPRVVPSLCRIRRGSPDEQDGGHDAECGSHHSPPGGLASPTGEVARELPGERAAPSSTPIDA